MQVLDIWLVASVAMAALAAFACCVVILRSGARRGAVTILGGGSQAGGSAPWLLTLVWPLLAALGWLLRPLMSAQWRHSLYLRLERAGMERILAPQHLVALQLASATAALLVPCLPVMLGVTFTPWLVAVATALGAVWPLAWLHERSGKRLAKIVRDLPFLIDLLAMSVEAGLPLPAAFTQSVERLPAGPLRDECRRVVRDVQAGRGRDEALRALASRLDIAGVTQLVMALAAAQRDGSGIVRVLKAQAEQQRTERFLRAEHRAAQAPVRMLFPLLCFIFPGTLAVLLFPVVSRLFSEMGRWQ